MKNKTSKINIVILVVILILIIITVRFFIFYQKRAVPPVSPLITETQDENGISGINTPDTNNWLIIDYPSGNNWNQPFKLPQNWSYTLEQYQAPGQSSPTAIRFYLFANGNQNDPLGRIYLGVPTLGTTPIQEYIVRTNGNFSYAVPKDASIQVKEIFTGIVASTYEDYAEKITSPFVLFDKWKESVGITFQYPSQYQYSTLNKIISGEGHNRKKYYSLDVGPAISVNVVEKGYRSEGDPSSLDAINSDYSKCDAFLYITKNGTSGYKLKGGYQENESDNCSNVQGMYADGYTLYIFDTIKFQGKILFMTNERNEQLLESILNTLKIN